MPYKNIVFAKLEKRLFNDHRWYMMNEQAQLNYIRFILFASESYNKIPKNLEAIKKAFKTDQDLKTIETTIKEIKINFPKFKENKHFYYFDDFQEKTNYIPHKESPRKAQGLPKEGVDKEEDKDKEENKDKYKEFVRLTKKEHQKLIDTYGDKATNEYIQRLNDYLGSTGRRYKSHYHTILTWIRRDPPKNKPQPDYRTPKEKRHAFIPAPGEAGKIVKEISERKKA